VDAMMKSFVPVHAQLSFFLYQVSVQRPKRKRKKEKHKHHKVGSSTVKNVAKIDLLNSHVRHCTVEQLIW
jgi:hypothetical protein